MHGFRQMRDARKKRWRSVGRVEGWDARYKEVVPLICKYDFIY